ncbi:MAG TPA: hypothetical protein VGF67_26305 [Ktedonobacteraceae bacterium]|jgi:hypothetical protein
MNTLEEHADHRAPIDYHVLLHGVKKYVEKMASNLLEVNQSRITFDIDAIAHAVASYYPQNTPFFRPRKEHLFVSTHLADLAARATFADDIQKLRASLHARFCAAISPQQGTNADPAAFVRKLFIPIQDFAQERSQIRTERDPQGLRYERLHASFPLKKQRLHLRNKRTEQAPCLKGHKLTIQVDRLKDFASQITSGIVTFLHSQPACTPDDIEQVEQELRRCSQKKDSDLSRLSDALVRHSLARIQRSAQIHYLHYLQKGLQDWPAPARKHALPWLITLTSRLERLEAYIANPTREDAFYRVEYQQNQYNLRDLFTRADAFDTLPIITVIDGMLGEQSQSERAQKTFTFGVKLKLNGPVQAHSGAGKSVFAYYSALLDPASDLYRQRERETQASPRDRLRFLEKVLKVALLYRFVFTHLDQANFDPTEEADQLLAVLRGNDEQQKSEKLAQLYKTLVNCERRYIEPLRDMLAAFLHNQKIGLPRYDEALILSLRQTILADDLDSVVTRYDFFQEDWMRNDGKDILKYVSVEHNGASSEAICRFPVTLTFETIYYDLAPQPAEHFSMAYQIERLLVLPVVFAPFEQNRPDQRAETFVPARHLIFSYRQRDFQHNALQMFVYRCTYILLTYLLLKILLDESIPQEQRRRTFLPIVCMHTKPEEVDASQLDQEAFLHNFTKILAHMLAEDYQANSQGLNLQSTSDHYKLPNALASLYNMLPRVFSPSAVRSHRLALDRLAIITVSSRKADLSQGSPEIYSSTIYGDVIGMEKLADGSILGRTLTTFSDNAEATAMHQRPEVILEQVRTCFQQGYRHFLYVAQTPYTSTLHLPSADVSANLFFMNEAVIQAMREVDDTIKVYPIFCDNYHVVRQRALTSTRPASEQTAPAAESAPVQEADSLYIDDLLELSALTSDKHKRTVTFFNIFNGLTVGRKADPDTRLYNRVISYGTLVNMYEDTLYYQYIWQDLLGERLPGSLATGLLDLLTLLHFMRYEKSKPDRFKLDPYSRIIGSESVGKRAIFPHATGTTRFNSLAFLTLVRSVLQKHS